MVGSKANLARVRQAALDAGATSVDQTQFCQGRTMRWGFAWAFGEHLEKAKKTGIPFYGQGESDVPGKKSKKPQEAGEKPPLTWVVPEDSKFSGDLNKACAEFENLLKLMSVSGVDVNVSSANSHIRSQSLP
jgi:hypothetical protein